MKVEVDVYNDINLFFVLVYLKIIYIFYIKIRKLVWLD